MVMSIHEMYERIRDLHPKHIVVTKKELYRQLLLDLHCGKLILRLLAAGKRHPRFDEWLTKLCYHLQLISSFVYFAPDQEEGSSFRRRVAKLPAKKYEALIFDGYCETLEECRERLADIYNEDDCLTGDLSDPFVSRMFEKYCAVKRYTLPMLTNTSEFDYFSFFRYVLLYVVENDTYPEFPISSAYKYPLMPGMCTCDVDLEY